MHPHSVLLAILTQVPDAPAPATPFWAMVLGAASPLTLLGLIWFIATYKSRLDSVLRVVDLDGKDGHLGTRVARVETIVMGDGKESLGCGQKHRLIEERLSSAPSRNSMNEAFTKITQLTERLMETQRTMESQSAEYRREMEVAITEFRGTARRLEEKLNLVLGLEEGDEGRGIGRQRTNPRIDLGKKGG